MSARPKTLYEVVDDVHQAWTTLRRELEKAAADGLARAGDAACVVALVCYRLARTVRDDARNA